MLQTVKDACELHPMALDYAMGDQIEHLTDLLAQTEKSAGEFFEKNFVTAGMATLLRQGLQRLAGQSDQAVFELKQAMGGGKTHSMLALGVLARNPNLRPKVDASITGGIADFTAQVVAINGRSVSEDVFLWGEVARQLGKEADFSRFWTSGPRAPMEADWVGLIGDTPTLILLDELPPYFDYATTRQVGGGTLATVATYALSNLLSAALKLPKLCIVISNLSGSYEGASKDLSKAIRNFRDEANRQARPITPVELGSNEIYEILKKRLFKSIAPPSVVDAVAAEYGKALADAVKSKAIAKSAEQLADEIAASYPFHPSVKQVVALFKENEAYRQTRGLMQFVSKMLKSVWERSANDVYLIGCQHLDLNIGDVREEVARISDLQGAISTDVAAGGSSHAEIVDANVGADTASQVGRLLLVASLSESVDAVKGLTKAQAVEYLVAPHRSALEFDQAFEELRKECWYLHRKENDAWYFSKNENLRKRIDNRAKNAPQNKVNDEMKRRLELVFQPRAKVAYQRVIALPKLDEIAFERTERLCLVMSPDAKSPPEDARRLFESVTQKNAFCVVTGGTSLGNLEEKVRRIWAIAKVRDEVGTSSPLLPEIQDEAESAEFDFLSTMESLFNRVYYPANVDGAGPDLRFEKITLVRSKDAQDGIAMDGEAAVQRALVGTGASKLKTDVKAEADALIRRAEAVLWNKGETRLPWKDVVTRSVENARWIWLPPKGLEELRAIAVSQDRWRDSNDGYIEKGPFPPAKTSVTVLERDYDEGTGRATLLVSAKDAGSKPVIHYASDAGVSPASPTLTEAVFETTEMKLWFVAVDPDAKHATGDAVAWENRITILHEPTGAFGKRTVELKAVPGGNIRWNTTGASPKDGTPYTGPFDVEGTAEVTVYAYAEQGGVSAQRSFKIPALDAKGPSIADDKPAKLRRMMTFDGTAKSFEAIKLAKNSKATFGGTITAEVGKGSRNVLTRLGSEASTTPDVIERMIGAAREALGEDAADVRLSFKEASFLTGHDLKAFAKGLGIDPKPEEVEQ
ncbi:anti-phage-associated DUF499 domain-containing protein [Methylobacterium aquaticum]|uniref:Predicted ATPase AAA+ superfamily n=1 Tax=Methylobacterium aquaticum TaxID=270351 RepID=A0A0C6FFQ2_9HYPH|nr:anti-phage-associated DUF499 domain-containing protein [Methylobacterium aquaticum]BAQ45812.1 predicted ATPase AAA+ superfamily [Methylobacterium aquaticum]